MSEAVNLPRLGDTVDEVLVLEWLVSVGSQVVQGDPLVRVETDKVEVEVESPLSGSVEEILVNVGDEVKTGALICRITSQI
jgi:pyruvate/2-oxoglutarate dehydrogenase complex dihydrolipoamide acyltransferase (E2) component